MGCFPMTTPWIKSTCIMRREQLLVDFSDCIHILTTDCAIVTSFVPVADMLSKKQFIKAIPWRDESRTKPLLGCHAEAIGVAYPTTRVGRAMWSVAPSGAQYSSILNHIMSMAVLPLTTGKRESTFYSLASTSNPSITTAKINTLLR